MLRVYDFLLHYALIQNDVHSDVLELCWVGIVALVRLLRWRFRKILCVGSLFMSLDDFGAREVEAEVVSELAVSALHQLPLSCIQQISCHPLNTCSLQQVEGARSSRSYDQVVSSLRLDRVKVNDGLVCKKSAESHLLW